jgi:hypothetical protein
MGKVLPILRKCACLINRDDGAGVIVKRIIGSDPTILAHLSWIFQSMRLETEAKLPLSLPEAIEAFGWPIVREVALVVLLHEIHDDFATRLGLLAHDLDRRALGVLTAGAELGANGHAALFANLGEIGLALHDTLHGTNLDKLSALSSEDTVFAERQNYGFDHGVLGAYMLNEVDFPTEVCEEVFSHTVVGSPIWIAEQLCSDLGMGGRGERTNLALPLSRRLGYSDRRLARLKVSIQSAGELPYLAFNGPSAEAA